MNGLGEEFIGAVFNAFDAIVKIAEAGDEHDGRETCRRVRLETAADLEPIELRHGDVEQHHVWMGFVDRSQRRLAIADIDDFVAVPGQELPIQRANAFRVVRDEDAAPPRRGSDLRGELNHRRDLRNLRRALARTHRHRNALVQSVAFQLAVERPPAYAEQSGRYRLVAADLLKGPNDVLAFDLHE